jgi:AcrR family transcriptional regulator
VLQAADDLLVQKGFAGVTIEGIAAAAGVAKQTIYRWWSSKTEVLLDAFLQDAEEALTPSEHGELRQDLTIHVRRVAWFLTASDAGAVFRALIGQAQHDAEFAGVLRRRYLDEQRRRDRRPFEWAVRRQEIPADIDLDAEVDQLVGPVYHRVLVTGEDVDDAFTERLVDGVLARLRPRSPA